jgi:outer membrane lipoprotein carrier protein
MRSFECPEKSSLPKKEGEALVTKLQSSYTGFEALHGSFRQESFLAALDVSEASSGEMWFARPGKMRWVYTEPKPQIVVIRDGTLWLYQADKRQVMIDDIGEVLLSDLPISFMMGLGSLARDFEFKGACRSADGVVLSLVPRPKAGDNKGVGELSGFDLLVDEGAAVPKGARVASLGGNVTAIVFENITSKGVTPEPSAFVLEYPKGVDIMDRRVHPRS